MSKLIDLKEWAKAELSHVSRDERNLAKAFVYMITLIVIIVLAY